MFTNNTKNAIFPILFILAWSASLFADDSQKASVKNELRSLTLADVEVPRARFELEYSFDGLNGPAFVSAEIPPKDAKPGALSKGLRSPYPLSPGKNKANVWVNRPFDRATLLETRAVRVVIWDKSDNVLADRTFDLTVKWPSTDPFMLNSNDQKELDRVYTLCVKTIDAGNDFVGPRRGLERIVLANPEYVQAYAELARIYMKTNWNREGLGQAERALQTALRIDPKHANSLVLLGYVYAHQKRYKEAERELRRAEAIGTPNIWLYANLGELYAMQDDEVKAVAAYRKAITATKSLDTYERARADAYYKLIDIYSAKQQWSDVDQLQMQRVASFPENACYKGEHADFRLRKLGNYDSAITIATKAMEQGCTKEIERTLGAAYYTKWAYSVKSGAPAKEADQYFNRGQTLYAEVPALLATLASSEYTRLVIAALKRRNIDIDTLDRNEFSALALSLIRVDSVAAATLVQEGANVNKTFGPEKMTPLMIAASTGDKESVLMLLKNGANRAAKSSSGFTAESIAKANGFNSIARLLSTGGGA
jgi:tetratricopeptide (TPR) repeat protein